MSEVTQADEVLAVKMAGRGSYQQWCEWIADHRIQARREALEEAARVAKEWKPGPFRDVDDAGEEIAEAIRNLARFPTVPEAGKSES